MEVETPLILQGNQRDFVIELVDAVSRWMFSGLALLKKFASSICDWKNKFSIFSGKYHLFRIESFLSRVPMRPSSPTPQDLQPARHPSKFTPPTMRIRGTIQVRLSFQTDGFLTGPSQL